MEAAWRGSSPRPCPAVVGSPGAGGPPRGMVNRADGAGVQSRVWHPPGAQVLARGSRQGRALRGAGPCRGRPARLSPCTCTACAPPPPALWGRHSSRSRAGAELASLRCDRSLQPGGRCCPRLRASCPTQGLPGRPGHGQVRPRPLRLHGAERQRAVGAPGRGPGGEAVRGRGCTAGRRPGDPGGCRGASQSHIPTPALQPGWAVAVANGDPGVPSPCGAEGLATAKGPAEAVWAASAGSRGPPAGAGGWPAVVEAPQPQRPGRLRAL